MRVHGLEPVLLGQYMAKQLKHLETKGIANIKVARFFWVHRLSTDILITFTVLLYDYTL